MTHAIVFVFEVIVKRVTADISSRLFVVLGPPRCYLQSITESY